MAVFNSLNKEVGLFVYSNSFFNLIISYPSGVLLISSSGSEMNYDDIIFATVHDITSPTSYPN